MDTNDQRIIISEETITIKAGTLTGAQEQRVRDALEAWQGRQGFMNLGARDDNQADRRDNEKGR